MSTTWSFRVEVRAGVLGVVLGLSACASSRARSTVAPDSPLPTRPQTSVETGSGGQRTELQPVELTSVRLRLISSDTMLRRLAGSAILSATAPVAIDVTTAQPLGNVARTASPEIFVDGTPVGDTWPLPPNRLVAFLRDRQQLRVGSAITVAWLGNEEQTRTRRPIVLTQEHLQGIR